MNTKLPYQLDNHHSKRISGDILDIVKPDTIINNQDYYYQMWKEQTLKLTNLTEQANTKRMEEYHGGLFLNMTLLEILHNFSKNMNNIIDDILILLKTPDKNKLGAWIKILTKDKRMIYVGLFFLICSFVMYFISLSK